MSFVQHLIKPLRIVHNDSHAIVTLNIEFGFQYFLWFPELTPRELEQFWKSIRDIDKYWDNLKLLPGKLILADYKFFIVDQNNVDDVYPTVPMSIYEKLRNNHLSYRAHLFDNNNSILVSPKNKKIHHIGYETDHQYYVRMGIE
jgi:hypothetical protein